MSQIRKALDQTGVLLLTDTKLPSLTSIIAGEPIQGSWWGHPQGNLMYNLSGELQDAEDVLAVKLLNGKVTFITKDLWSALYTLATSQSEWQLKKLNPAAIKLLRTVQDLQSVQTDDSCFKAKPTEIGKLATQLESRLLIFSENTHTASGKHVRVLRTWKKQMSLKKFKVKKMSYDEALIQLNRALNDYSQGNIGLLKYPWL